MKVGDLFMRFGAGPERQNFHEISPNETSKS
jgi:hypothetical protein